MTSVRTLLFTLSLCGLALAGDVNLSGTYTDVAGGSVGFVQSGSHLMVKPDTDTMPEQVKKFVGQLRLKGSVESKPESRFRLSAKYNETLEPTPNMKLKVKIDFDAEGKDTAEGLAMHECSWRISAIAFAGGEIAGSETQEQKCVGLWARVK